MALFGRANLPHPATLSRDLSALDQGPVEALRSLFQEDLVARSVFAPSQGGVWDRQGQHWTVVDIDGTKQAARQRALPQTADLPDPHRRFDLVCAPGYLGRKRGEIVRTRTTVLQAHTHQWLASFGNAGNGDYRGELLRVREVISTYATKLALPLSHVLVRLDGLYGNAAPLADLLAPGGPGVVVRGKDYHLLDLPAVRARLQLPPDQQTRQTTVKDQSRAVRLPEYCAHARRTGGPHAAFLRVRLPTPHLPSARYVTGQSMNSSSPPSRQPPSLPLMCSISTCIEGPLKPCSPMKIRNKTRIAGFLIRPMGKSSGKSSLNGSGIFAWSSGSRCLLPACV